MTIEEQLKTIIKTRYKSVRAFTNQFEIPYTTLDSVFKRGISNSGISTILKIFGSLNLDVESIPTGILTEKSPASAEADTGDQRLDGIIENYHQLNEAGKDDLAKHADHLTYIPEYKNGKMVHIKVQKSAARMQPGESYEDIPAVDEITGTIVNSEEDL